MRTIKLALFSLSITSLLAAACGGEETAATCTTAADCDDGQLCHPSSGVCVANCNEDTLACSGTSTPLCRTTDGDPLENMCVCDATSCAAGETCNATTGLCEFGNGNPGPDPNFSCTTGETTLCESGQVCVGGNACEAMCDNLSQCLSAGAICDPSTDSATFNECRDPDSVAVCNLGCFATCSDKAGHTRESGGPIIFDLQISGDMGSSANCRAPAVVDRFVVSVYSENDLSSNVFTETIRLLSAGQEGNTYSGGTNSGSHPTVESRGNNIYDITFFLCNDLTQNTIFSVFVRDESGRDSNAICFAPTQMN